MIRVFHSIRRVNVQLTRHLHDRKLPEVTFMNESKGKMVGTKSPKKADFDKKTTYINNKSYDNKSCDKSCDKSYDNKTCN